MNVASDRARGSGLLDGAGTGGRGARLVARTLFREMQRSGFSHGQVLAVVDELLGCLCAKVREREEAGAPVNSWEPERTRA